MTKFYIKAELTRQLYMESIMDLIANSVISYDEEKKQYYISPDALEEPALLHASECSNNAHDESIHADIIAFLNEQTGSRFKPTIKRTKDLITGRLKEGYTVEDFKRVIAFKAKEWGRDPHMKKFLKPSTLFAQSNFEAYLNYAPALVQNPVTEEPKKEEVEEVKEYGVSMDW